MILTKEMRELLKRSPHDLELDERIVNQLERAGIFTIEMLLHKTEAEIRALPNLGDKAMTAIFSKLAERGFVRRGPEPPPPKAPKKRA